MNIIKSKKFKLLLAMISLLVLVNTIQESYAKYISSASANSNFSIAQWTFKVNDQDVLSNNEFSSTIVPVINENDNIREGYIAPTSTGYFDIIIDYSNVGVAFNEVLTLAPGTNSVADLKITGYSVNDGSMIPFANDNYNINVNHYLNDGTYRDVYRFYVEWIDGDGESMDNAADTEASQTRSASIAINLKFIQLAH